MVVPFVDDRSLVDVVALAPVGGGDRFDWQYPSNDLPPLARDPWGGHVMLIQSNDDASQGRQYASPPLPLRVYRVGAHEVLPGGAKLVALVEGVAKERREFPTCAASPIP